MYRLNPLRHPALLWISGFVAVAGFASKPEQLMSLVAPWVLYVLLFAVVGIIRDGIRGLMWTSAALVGMAFLHRPLAPEMVAVFLLVGTIYLAKLLIVGARKYSSWHLGRVRAVRHRAAAEAVVTVIASPVSQAPDARDILARFGFGEA